MLRLFDRCHAVLAPGGLLILEPQPWKSYRQALRKQHVRVVQHPLLLASAETPRQMPQEVQDQFRTLKLRPDDFATLLQERTGFASVQELREGGHRGFDRPLLLCRKANA